MECIFSFICSSNNNIPRITGMLEKLRTSYGELLLSVGKGGLAATGVLGDVKVKPHLEDGTLVQLPSCARPLFSVYFASVARTCMQGKMLRQLPPPAVTWFRSVACAHVPIPCSLVFQEFEDWAKLPLELHSFPTVDALATRATEADLRAMGEQLLNYFSPRVGERPTPA